MPCQKGCNNRLMTVGNNCCPSFKPALPSLVRQTLPAFVSSDEEEKQRRQCAASTDCPLQKHKNKLCCPGSAREIDFCSSLLNGGVHLYVGAEERSTTGPFVLPRPKSFRSIGPLQFILSILPPPHPQKGGGGRSDRRSPDC